MEVYEVVYSEDISDDFLNANLSEKKVLAIDEKIKILIAPAPFRRTEKVENVSEEYNLRKARFGDYRMFLEVDVIGFVMTCLCFLHRNKSYSEKSISKAVSILLKERTRRNISSDK